MKDYYYILGVKQTATTDDVKKAYRKLSLKFHPDKNDGDDFFTERFKEIQEAYETLNDASRRSIYDRERTNYSSTKNTNNGSNFSPDIEYFKSDKTSFEFDEEITFSWKTINSNKVTIKPFGQVQSIGQKTYRIKDFKNPTLTFELFAENTTIDRQVKTTLTLKNKTFQDLYNFFKAKITEENYERSKKTQNQDFSSSKDTTKEAPDRQSKLDAESDKESKQITNTIIAVIVIIGIVMIVALARK